MPKTYRKGRGSVQPIRLSRVLTSVLVGQANGLPRVVNVANEERDTDTWNQTSPDDTVNHTAIHAKVLHGLHGKESSEQCGKVIKEELRETSHVSSRHGQAIVKSLKFLLRGDRHQETDEIHIM